MRRKKRPSPEVKAWDSAREYVVTLMKTRKLIRERVRLAHGALDALKPVMKTAVRDLRNAKRNALKKA